MNKRYAVFSNDRFFNDFTHLVDAKFNARKYSAAHQAELWEVKEGNIVVAAYKNGTIIQREEN